jgi:predicted nucleic acid-binding protein
MRYVLDASVALKWVLDETDSPKAKQVRSEFLQQIHELRAPDTFPVEVAHALAKAERRGIIPRFQASRLLANVLSTPPQPHPYLPLLSRALDVASQARIGVYDCLYVALAEREACDLLTADDRLVRSLPGHPIVLLSSLP